MPGHVFQNLLKWIQNHTVITAIVCAVTVFIGFHIYVYSHTPMSWWPIGWDTAYYIRFIDMFRTNGIVPTLVFDQYVNFLYMLIASFLPIPAPTIEIYSPLFLAGLLVVSYSLVGHFAGTSKLGIAFGAVAIASWFTVFRFMTDLNSELFGLSLSLMAVAFGIKALRNKSNKFLAISAGLFFISSLAHTETTMFIFVIFAICSLIILGFAALKKIILILLAIVPSGLVFLISEIHLATLFAGNGIQPYNPPDSLQFWLQTSSYVFLPASIALVILFLCQYKKNNSAEKNWYTTFIITWFLVSLAIASIQYFYDPVQAFSERALLLLPSPMVTAVLLVFFYRRFPRAKVFFLVAAVILLVSASYAAQTSVISNGYTTQWISSSEMQRLQWLSSNFRSSELPIFVMNWNDQYFGANSQLWDNWIQDIYGNHLTYLGNVSQLIEIAPSKFVYAQANQASNYFFDLLQSAGIRNSSSLLVHPVLLISNFYQDLPKQAILYTNGTRQIYPGVFLVNCTTFEQSTSIPASDAVVGEYPGWYPIQQNWALSGNVLEYYSAKQSTSANATFILHTGNSRTWGISAFLNAASYVGIVEFKVNQSITKVMEFNGTGSPSVVKIASGVPANSTVFITVVLPVSNPERFAFLDLDSFLLTPNS